MTSAEARPTISREWTRSPSGTGGPAARPLTEVNEAEVATVEPESPPIDESIPEVAERLAEIEASGGEILGGSTVEYTEEGAGEDGVTTRALPSGCSLTVLIYRQVNQIVSDNLTSCTFSFASAAMSSTIGFYAWAHFNNIVARKSAQRTGGASLALEYAYTCYDNVDRTIFRTVTNGTLVTNGTTYSAAAYDEVDQNNCGTS